MDPVSAVASLLTVPGAAGGSVKLFVGTMYLKIIFMSSGLYLIHSGYRRKNPCDPEVAAIGRFSKKTCPTEEELEPFLHLGPSSAVLRLFAENAEDPLNSTSVSTVPFEKLNIRSTNVAYFLSVGGSMKPAQMTRQTSWIIDGMRSFALSKFS
ncbi:hypothetical protein IQ07DRAFT_626315 [Pyrenochaeta sp. DS3sAY3a]|nr:hypothetical protein IQ07DRAFT_626315 [Pyrenochaeta sp. DS3sAY3a]